MVINSSQVLISELEFRSHSGDLAPLLYYYKQKPCTLQGCKIDNSLTNICRWCTEMCVFWPKAAALPCFPAEHSANAVIHSPYELLVPLIPLKNCFHTSIAARLILPENILLSEDYSTLLFQRILWSLPPIHPENPESPPTYSWISDNFSVTQQVTCSLKCDLLGHILASEAISAKWEKRKFWLLFSLTNFLFNKAANKPTADHSMAIHRRLDSFSLIFYLLLILWVKTELRQNLPHITFGFQLLRFLSANKHFCWTSRAVKTL